MQGVEPSLICKSFLPCLQAW